MYPFKFFGKLIAYKKVYTYLFHFIFRSILMVVHRMVEF